MNRKNQEKILELAAMVIKCNNRIGIENSGIGRGLESMVITVDCRQSKNRPGNFGTGRYG